MDTLLSLEDHAQSACYASLAIQRAMGTYAEKIMLQNGVDFQMRIGLNSGSVLVGTIGDDLRMDYFMGESYWNPGRPDKASGYLKGSAKIFEEMGMDYLL